MSKYQTVILSEEALKRIVTDPWLPEEDLTELKQALQYIIDENSLELNTLKIKLTI